MSYFVVEKLELDEKGSIRDNSSTRQDSLYNGFSWDEANKIAKKSLPSILMETIFLEDGFKMKYKLYKGSEDIEEGEICMSDKEISKICEPYREEIIKIGNQALGISNN